MSHHAAFALLLFPNLCFPGFPFIFLAENPLRSAVEAASVLLLNRFLPPNPNFSSFFCLLSRLPPFAAPSLPTLGDRSSLAASSSATSKRSSSLAAPLSVFFLSAADLCQFTTTPPKIEQHTSLQQIDLIQGISLRLIPLLKFRNLHLFPKFL